ncbi:MAG: hypothetical protein JST64_06585, partial [Actinobacteria bacterium]|nr:hypothetical protein [Actinomycetota bacterium]
STTTTAPDCADTLPSTAKAAQLLMVMVTSPDAAAEPLTAGLVGGFRLKGNQSRDVGSQITAAVKGAPITPSVGTDEEGGTAQPLRLALGELPAAATAAKGSATDAAAAAGSHAAAMKRLGFTMNFAPVADVGSGPGLGTRTYGSDPATVSRFVDAVFPAIADAGLTPVITHWPGLGGANDDPQQQLPTLSNLAALQAKDLIPFTDAIRKGVPAILVTHAAVPGTTESGEPASLSNAAITGELRGNEGFKGLVITDSLGMGAVTRIGSQAELAEKAIAAGADIATVSGTDAVADVHARLVEAIDSGRLPSAQVTASVRRVLASKGIDGPCLDAVARYAALARTDTTTSTRPDATSAAGGTGGTGDTNGTGGSTGGTGSSGGTGSPGGTGSSGTQGQPTTTSRSSRTTTTIAHPTTVRRHGTTTRPTTVRRAGTTTTTAGVNG